MAASAPLGTNTVIHKVAFEQTEKRYWFAQCDCGWISNRFARLADAERDGIAHVREHNERGGREPA